MRILRRSAGVAGAGGLCEFFNPARSDHVVSGNISLMIWFDVREAIQIIRCEAGRPIDTGLGGIAQPVEAFETRAVAEMEPCDGISRLRPALGREEIHCAQRNQLT